MESSYKKFILASQSPRRRQLLEQAGYRFEVVASPVDEPRIGRMALPARHLAEALAYFKARAVFDAHRPDLPVLAADTVAAMDGVIFGKPADVDEARAMISAQAGRSQEVITGVALLAPGARRVIASKVTVVRMAAVTPEQLERYLAGGLWEGKAGAYGIQDGKDAFVERVEGSMSNVVGLPMELVARLPGLSHPANAREEDES